MQIYLFLAIVAPSMGNYLFLSMGAQLYIPSQHYSLMQIEYNVASIQNKLFDIGIDFTLNQVHH